MTRLNQNDKLATIFNINTFQLLAAREKYYPAASEACKYFKFIPSSSYIISTQ